MGQRRFRQNLQRLVVIHIVTAENAAVSVRGILTHTNIGNDIQLRKCRLDMMHCTLYNAVRLPCAAADFILFRRDSEE